MSRAVGTLNDFIEEKLLHLHTSTIARVERVNSNKTYDVQPLIMTKEVGDDDGELLPLLVDVPATGFKGKIDGSLKEIEPAYEKGDIVVIAFAERAIDTALTGREELPPDFRRHSLNDAYITGVFL